MMIPLSMGIAYPTYSKEPSSLSMSISKRVMDKRNPFLTLILQLIYYDHPSVILSLAITFSLNIFTTTLNSI